jgi:hypothetical protein
VEQDEMVYVSQFRQDPHEIAQDIAESYMKNYLYDWEDDETKPTDLFQIIVDRDNGIYVVEFWSLGSINLATGPDHTINVEISRPEIFS